MNLCTHLRWVGLHRGQIVLQGQAAVVVEYGLHSDQMGLHQPLPLSGDLLLERLQHRLEVLMEEGSKRGDGVNLGLFSLMDSWVVSTSFRACRSVLGKFLDWLSASAHSFMI